MQLRITHTSTYQYESPVQQAQHMAWLQPADTLHQQLLQHQLDIAPQPVTLRTRQDVYGNTCSYFGIESPHDTLQVVSRSLVRTQAAPICYSHEAWEAVRQRFSYQVGQPFDVAAEFLFASPYVPLQACFAEYAAPSFHAGRSMFESCIDLCRRIHDELQYAPHSTTLHTPVDEVLALRRGVCQDFAHLMLASLRSMGLPARYVSGYLLTRPPPGQPRLIGADASHAWVSVYLPDAMVDLQLSPPPLHDARQLPFTNASGIARGYWCDFDPTNHRFGWGTPGEDYVTVATGRDFGDVTPLRGVLQGGQDHSLHVGVTVEPA